MSDLYKVDQIAGKGLGCIATKDIKRGTLILREAAQVSGTNGELDEKSFSIDKLLMSFDKLSDEDKKAYMQLDSETEAENVCWRDLKSEWGAENCEKVNPGKMAEIMKIVDIYRVNGCMNGCSIRTSRFNHSCRSNAEATGDGIQAVTNIKYGEEITINYFPQLSMKSMEDRKAQIWKNRGFHCRCPFCNCDEEARKQQICVLNAVLAAKKQLPEQSKEVKRTMCSFGKETAADEFAKLEREAKESRAPAKAAANVKNATAWQATKKTKEELMESKKQTVVYKRMYQIAKEQQVSRVFIEGKILDPAFCHTVQLYMSAAISKDEALADGLLSECESFARVGLAISKVLTKSQHQEWLKRTKVDNWVEAAIMKNVTNLNQS